MESKTHEAISAQINHEFSAAYLYLSISQGFETKNLSGFAKWMRGQSAEEYEHAMKFIDFMNSVGAEVMLRPIPQPDYSFSSALKALDHVLNHEKHVTALIHEIYRTAEEEKDYGATEMLRWFITEQIEEEGKMRKAIERVKIAGDSGPGLLAMDRELGEE